jgi:KipI family sensor histidine kinase inhibitor
VSSVGAVFGGALSRVIPEALISTPDPEPVFEQLGDSSLLLSWPQLDDRQAEAAVHAAHSRLAGHADPAIRGLVPGWSTLAVHFHPLDVSAEVLAGRLRMRLNRAGGTVRTTERCHRIPVSFAPEHAVDLRDVATACSLTVSDCIAILTTSVFRVRMIGFAPGFPYLSGLPEVLHLPRRATPRLTVPAGSIAIAGGLAGIYPQASPGGWHILGHTTLSLFDPRQSPPCLLQTGDEVRFERLGADGVEV